MYTEVMDITPDFFTNRTGTRLAWLGMAGAILNTHGMVVLIDPLLGVQEQDGRKVSEAGFALDLPLPITAAEIHQADLVCYTHADHDHIGQQTARALSEQTSCQFLAPPPVAAILTSLGISEDRIHSVQDFETLTFGDLEVTVTPALHNWQPVDPWQRGDCCGYLLRTPDGTIWHPGDTRLIDELYQFKNVDVLFFDVADVDSHLGPLGSARLAAACGARVLIPYHFWTFGASPGPFADFDPRQLSDSISGLQVRLLSLAPGEVLVLPV
jgi:L-ascorbate metabolism protein UlaG (beta-lactamase superfamily)